MPFAVTVHAPNEPLAPPAGMDSAKVTLLPDSEPDTVPFAFVPVPVSVIDSVPVNVVPDCVMVQAIEPGPDESVAVPDQVPEMLVGGAEVDDELEGEVGDDPPPLLQPAATSARPRAAPAMTPENRVRIMMETRRILRRVSSVHLHRIMGR